MRSELGAIIADLEEKVERLRAAIRQHRDERGDDRCHADDGRLYAALPEGDTRPEYETAVTIENCQRYIECRQTGREYVSPQRRIEELERLNAELAARVAAQSNLLSRQAERANDTKEACARLAERCFDYELVDYPFGKEAGAVPNEQKIAAAIRALKTDSPPLHPVDPDDPSPPRQPPLLPP